MLPPLIPSSTSMGFSALLCIAAAFDEIIQGLRKSDNSNYIPSTRTCNESNTQFRIAATLPWNIFIVECSGALVVCGLTMMMMMMIGIRATGQLNIDNMKIGVKIFKYICIIMRFRIWNMFDCKNFFCILTFSFTFSTLHVQKKQKPNNKLY